ncbi:hypothetical protein COCCADRAFT_86952, partial [Bipolaris zeicola 26-R-13]
LPTSSMSTSVGCFAIASRDLVGVTGLLVRAQADPPDLVGSCTGEDMVRKSSFETDFNAPCR